MSAELVKPTAAISPVVAAALVGVASAVVIWILWGHTTPVPAIHDEAAYLLQARIFAAGACKAPAPPAPEFFEQFHVLVTPFVAAKYPPGHALVLALGVLIGAPVVVPLLLVGAAGALLFSLVRAFAGGTAAVLAWALWLLAPLNTVTLPSYMSETTSLLLGLAVWAATFKWWNTRRAACLYVAAACAGWFAITRPLTALVWSIPLGVVVLREAWRRRAREVIPAVALGLMILGIFPAWNRCTTGSWSSGPLALYRATYMPWDRMGFGLDSTPPRRTTQPDLEALATLYRDLHRQRTLVSALRSTLPRAGQLSLGAYGPGIVFLLPLALLGILYVRAAWVGLATFGLMIGAYALYPHPLGWNAYYVEVLPVLAGLPLLGVAWLERRRATSTGSARRMVTALTVVGYASVVATLVLDIERLPRARAINIRQQERAARFQELVASLPPEPAIVFVRYAARHNVPRSLVQNDPFFTRARIWVAYDRGNDDRRLLEAAPNRHAFLYDEASGTLRPFGEQTPGVGER